MQLEPTHYSKNFLINYSSYTLKLFLKETAENRKNLYKSKSVLGQQ
jgi:hypothetical protein